MDLGGGLGGAEGGGDDSGAVEPGGGGHAMTARDGATLPRGQHEGVHAAIAVVGPELVGQLGVQREAGASQRAELRAVAPVEGEEPTGLARCGARHAASLDHGDDHAATSQEVRDGGAHDPGATHHDVARGYRRQSGYQIESAPTPSRATVTSIR